MTEEMTNNITKIVEEMLEETVMRAQENKEEFIIETIYPYCENVLQMHIEKEKLKQILLNGIQKREWIPVSEKLPEPFTEVLVNITYDCKFEYVYIALYCPDIGLIDKDWDISIKLERPLDWYHVTAWMPMPKPYKESEG